MIGTTRQVTVYAYTQPTDMRKSFDALSALVTYELHGDPPVPSQRSTFARFRFRLTTLQPGVCRRSRRVVRPLASILERKQQGRYKSGLVARVKFQAKTFDI